MSNRYDLANRSKLKPGVKLPEIVASQERQNQNPSLKGQNSAWLDTTLYQQERSLRPTDSMIHS